MKAVGALTVALIALTACQRTAPQSPPTNTAENEAAPAIPPPATGPDSRTPFGEPRNALDPNGVEAAAEVVRQFASLMDERKYHEAAKLWVSNAAEKAFANHFRDPEVHVRIGKLGQTEGAAGSIYTTLPVVFYGDASSQSANLILRRVNNVPDSSAAERGWRIERIDWRN